ncbi:uncharacterized protein LOC107864566 isoform X2 [Capsicum annuum]|uniref:uncharacterized protein LOC107864566 isoform X2 n=1 Tax=Capsicum annuum TaxID=4072 RepID=UPI001FB16E07|nr:uncharacterized protein LOC107864566 isoform X2 [Capsicum annuum]XP_047264978.1 uncharacterized protein LOC107864566 isoform X2 [Capsicum annuum]XP_047264979.1 uncharacterized protein LOC107864566 isoform X2 [Capsicum annuum]
MWFRGTSFGAAVVDQFQLSASVCIGTDISHGLACGPSGSWAPCSIRITRIGVLQSPTTSVPPSPTRSNSDSAASAIVDSSLPISSRSSELPRQMPHLSSVQSNQLYALSFGSVLTPVTTQVISIGDS